MNNVISLNKRPIGKPTLGDFKFTEEEMPVSHLGEIFLKTLYVSVDPYLRGRMNDSKSYVPPFVLGQPIQSGCIAEVVESSIPEFKKGDFVSGNLDWKEYQVSTGKGLSKIDADASELSRYLGILGMTGLTAYFGLVEVADPKEGETIVVSGAAGAVGSVVGQIGKILGCKVVGITGSDEKVELLKSKFKFDEALNYKTIKNLNEAIKKTCPNGVDIYFDNVGGEISDAVLMNINKHASISICGAISLYNETKQPVGPRVQPILVTNSATMRGFIISDFAYRFEEGITQLAMWLKEGRLTYSETIAEGFDKLPQTFLDLFDGKNEGKMIVKV
jgi:NADPH:quinone reductase